MVDFDFIEETSVKFRTKNNIIVQHFADVQYPKVLSVNALTTM